MKDLITMAKDWLYVKVAKNPSPDLEKKIEESRQKLHDEVSLLRLSNAELTQASKSLRFEVMQELIDDVARSNK